MGSAGTLATRHFVPGLSLSRLARPQAHLGIVQRSCQRHERPRGKPMRAPQRPASKCSYMRSSLIFSWRCQALIQKLLASCKSMSIGIRRDPLSGKKQFSSVMQKRRFTLSKRDTRSTTRSQGGSSASAVKTSHKRNSIWSLMREQG